MRIAEDDLTARARIRDAAIEAFAARGFDATVREIATRAGVSAGLITHHFGSKDALRAACGSEVLRRLLELKLDGGRRSPREQVAMIAELDNYGPMFGYVLRSVRDGGEAGRAFLQNMIDDAKIYLAAGVASGQLRPSVDEDARARLLITNSIGGIVMQLTLAGNVDFSDGAAIMRLISDSTSLVLLELYTHGLTTDTALFDEYLRQVHPAGVPTTTNPTKQDRTEQ